MTRLIDAFASIAKLDNQLHLPVQSGSDRILAMMKRGYTQADYLRQDLQAASRYRPEHQPVDRS